MLVTVAENRLPTLRTIDAASAGRVTLTIFPTDRAKAAVLVTVADRACAVVTAEGSSGSICRLLRDGTGQNPDAVLLMPQSGYIAAVTVANVASAGRVPAEACFRTPIWRRFETVGAVDPDSSFAVTVLCESAK